MGRVWHWVLGVVLVLHAGAAIAQPVLAGMMLDGDVDVIGVHGVIGSTLPLYGFLALPIAVLFWRPRLWRGPRHGPWWPLVVIPLVFFAEGTQIGLGHTRDLGLHVPIGVAIVVATVLMAGWIVRWQPRPPAPPAPGGGGIGGGGDVGGRGDARGSGGPGAAGEPAGRVRA